MLTLDQFPIPILGFVAPSGTGKTTLIESVIQQLKAENIPLALIKSSHHHFEIDQKGKDSYRLHQAGASQTVLISPSRRFWLMDTPEGDEPSLEEALNSLQLDGLKIVLVEGFKQAKIEKIALYRKDAKKKLDLSEDLRQFIAIASDTPINKPASVKLLDLKKVNTIVEFIIKRYQLHD